MLEREFGQFPISIATSLALEGALGIYPEKETGVNVLLEYEEIWINLLTLFRNVVGALGKDALTVETVASLSNHVMRDIEVLEALFKEHGFQIKPVYYVSNYDGLAKRYPHAVLRTLKTDKQKLFHLFQTRTLKDVLQRLAHEGGRDTRVFDLKIDPKTHAKALMITHFAYDLLAHKRFGKLTLLESHTGALKERQQWYTKYYNGKELAMIPFREDFIQVFGDNELFHPWPKGARETIIELARAHRWNQNTTTALIEYNLSLLKDHHLRETLKAMLV